MPYPNRRSGGGGAAPLIVATRSDNSNPAAFADFSALEAYTATTEGAADANRINVSNSQDAREVFVVGTLNDENQVTSISAAYIRLNNLWVSVATNLVGSPGADGLQLEFNSRANLDQFFIENPDRLVNGLPVVMHMGDNVVTDLVWNGPDTPTDYVVDDQRWRVAASRVSNNSLFIGSTRVSNAVEDILVTTADGRRFLAVGVAFTNSGSSRLNDIELGATETLDVNLNDNVVLASPFTLDYRTFGNNLTVDFSFKPNEAGELRARYYLGDDNTGPIIFDETRTVTQAEVDSNEFIDFGIGNPYLLDQDIQIHTEFSGIQLKGGLVTGGQFDGQTIIAFKSTIQPFTRYPVARQNEITQSEPVDVGRDYRIVEGQRNYNIFVFKTSDHDQAITFSDGSVDIPGVPDDAFHTTGEYLVLQYPDGLSFVRVTSTTTGGGDIEGVVVSTVAFSNGGAFTPPNVATDIRIGATRAIEDPNTDVTFEDIREGSGNILGGDFTWPNYVDTRQVVFTLPNAAEAQYAANNILQPNVHAIGDTSLSSSAAVVITSSQVNPTNNAQVICDVAEPFTIGPSSSGAQMEVYDVTPEVIRHVIVDDGADVEASNGTLRFRPAMGGNGLQYSGDTPDNNELVVGTGSANTAKASGITLTSAGRIPFDAVGEADITLTGSGGGLTIDVNNIDTYKNRTIFINHTNTFTINLDAIDDFHDEDEPTFFLRFVNLTDRIVAVQGVSGETIGGRNQNRIPRNGSLTTELPIEGQTDWPILAAGNPLRRFDIVQVTASTSYGDDAALEFICDHLIEVTTNNDITLSFAPSTLDCAFWIQNQGTGTTTLEGEGLATIEGVTSIKQGELIWMWNVVGSNVYRAFRIDTPEPVVRSYGGWYDSGDIATTCTAAGTWYKVTPTTDPTEFPMAGFSYNDTTDRLVFEGDNSSGEGMRVSFDMNAFSDGTGRATFSIHRNGTVVNETRREVSMTANEKVNVSMNCILNLATDDYIEIYVQFNAPNVNVTSANIQLVAG